MREWQKLSSRAIFLRHAGRTAEGIPPMMEAIELAKPEPALALETNHMLNYLADMYLAEGLLGEAEATIREAIRHETEAGLKPSGGNRMILGKVLHQQGRCAEAVRTGKQALTIYKRDLGWRSDYYRQSKKLVANFKRPPVAGVENQAAVGRTA